VKTDGGHAINNRDAQIGTQKVKFYLSSVTAFEPCNELTVAHGNTEQKYSLL